MEFADDLYLKMTRFFKNNFVVALLICLVLGMVIPGVDIVPSQTLLFFLAGTIFVSSFQITLSEIRVINPLQVGGFYVARFIILPILIWVIFNVIAPAYAIGLFLLSLIPAGVASPGVSNINRGNISLSIVLVVVSSLLTPFILPLMLGVFVTKGVEINILDIFITLSLTVLLPVLLHYPLRRYRDFLHWIRRNDSLFVVPFIGAMVIIVFGKQKSFILDHLESLFLSLLLAAVAFGIFYITGWHASLKRIRENKISYALASGVNNTSLGIVIAFLYFQPRVSTFMVISELTWVLGIVVFRWFLGKKFNGLDS